MASPETPEGAFKIDSAIPEEGQEKFRAKIEEMKAQGFSEARTTFFSLRNEENQEENLKTIQLQPGEEIVESYIQKDDMQGADVGEAPMHIVYALIARKQNKIS